MGQVPPLKGVPLIGFTICSLGGPALVAPLDLLQAADT